MYDQPLTVKVWGRMACFTRPENKAERVSYPVMTPSAARGILEAIFWKPEFAYRVREIAVLASTRYISFVRNEVILKAARNTDMILADDPNVRAQRHTLALCGENGGNVAYIIHADAIVKPGVDANAAKYRDQFRRRVERGQCYHHPALGCREFTCDFAHPTKDDRPIAQSADFGLMLFDIAFGKSPDSPNVPLFFDAKLDNGVLHIPDDLYSKLEAIRL